MSYTRGDQALAATYWHRAVTADPGRASAWFNLALLYEAQGNLPQARHALMRFVATAGPEYAAQVRDAERRLAQELR